MKIKKRLQTIGDLVPLSSYPLDIGCDHGLLSIYLVKERNFSKVFASDNKEGPLQQAKKNSKRYQVEQNIILILKDGLEAYQAPINVITISGMGGILIQKLLLAKQDILKNIKALILSPNQDVYIVRQTLMDLNFSIKEETIVKENNKFYPIILAVPKKQNYSEKDLFLGPILQTKQEKEVIEYYQILLIEKQMILKKQIPNTKKQELIQEINYLKEIVNTN